MKTILTKIRQFLVKRNWHHPKPANIAKSVSIEAAELLELFQWSDETLDEVKKDSEKMTKLKEEVADIIIYALQLPLLLDFDIEKTILAKINRNEQRYPAKLIKNRAKVDQNSGNRAYLELKQRDRLKRQILEIKQ